jgi:hypothetical protein
LSVGCSGGNIEWDKCNAIHAGAGGIAGADDSVGSGENLSKMGGAGG